MVDLSRKCRCNQMTRSSNLFCSHLGYHLTPLLTGTANSIKVMVIVAKEIFKSLFDILIIK